MGTVFSLLPSSIKHLWLQLISALKGIRRFLRRTIKWFVPVLVLVFAMVWASIGIIERSYQFWDDEPLRGAVETIGDDKFGDTFNAVVYLDQGWAPEDSLWFYTTPQGSNLLPYDFFLALEQPASEKLFRDDENMNRYGYLPQRKTFSNPDALPVGVARDTFRGRDYMGFTCAACHTSQLNYQNVAIRIDGGPAAADLERFMNDLADALYTTYENPEKFERFAQSVMAVGSYNDRDAVRHGLESYARRIRTYNIINYPRDSRRELTHYGYARLDAFGRIFNRVLEHLVTSEQIDATLRAVLAPEKYQTVIDAIRPVLYGEERRHLLYRIEKIVENQLTLKELLRFRNHIFNPADAPVSYPFLWDVPQHDYVQWNGSVANAKIGPLGRNAAQVIGVFGSLDWQQHEGITLSSVLAGQGLNGPHVSFESSINLRNLRWVENQLRKLQSPQWPESILGEIDRKKATQGKKLFDRYCLSCHQHIDRDSDKRRVVAHISSVSNVGTDAKMATNAVNFTGYSGLLQNQYIDTAVGDVLLQERFPVAPLLRSATRNTVLTPDPDKLFVQRYAERAFDFFLNIFDNEVKPSLTHGDYQSDTTAQPFASLMAYKARPLNGIWATAPYLHNGSVPTLYHLLLPKKGSAGDCGSLPESDSYRPDEFRVGSREFDPEYVGFRHQGYDGFKFQTHIYGNYNTGHEYAAGKTRLPDGSCLPPLNAEQRWQLVEYLKTL